MSIANHPKNPKPNVLGAKPNEIAPKPNVFAVKPNIRALHLWACYQAYRGGVMHCISIV